MTGRADVPDPPAARPDGRVSPQASDTSTRETRPARPLDLACTERELHDAIVEFLRLTGWRVFHARAGRSQRGRWAVQMQGDTGWPDITATRGGLLVFIEVKSEKGRTRPDQDAWLEALGSVDGVIAMVARPSTWSALMETLR